MTEVRSCINSENFEELKIKTKELQEFMATLISNIPDPNTGNATEEDGQSIETEID